LLALRAQRRQKRRQRQQEICRRPWRSLLAAQKDSQRQQALELLTRARLGDPRGPGRAQVVLRSIVEAELPLRVVAQPFEHELDRIARQ